MLQLNLDQMVFNRRVFNAGFDPDPDDPTRDWAFRSIPREYNHWLLTLDRMDSDWRKLLLLAEGILQTLNTDNYDGAHLNKPDAFHITLYIRGAGDGDIVKRPSDFITFIHNSRWSRAGLHLCPHSKLSKTDPEHRTAATQLTTTT